MRRTLPSWLPAAILLLVSVLSGCAEQQDPSGRAVSTSASSVVEVTPPSDQPGAPATGTIEGLVRDEELQPVAGARISLHSAKNLTEALAVAEASVEGAFAFQGLTAGEYAVVARKNGYKDAAPTSVLVADGTTKVNIALVKLAEASEPYYETITQRQSVQSRVCVKLPPTTSGSSTWTCGGSEATVGTFATYLENDTGTLHTVITEMKWTPTLGACTGGMRVDVISPQFKSNGAVETRAKTDAGDPASWTNAPNQVRTPVRFVVPRDGEDPIAMHSPDRTERNGGSPIPTSGRWGGVYSFYPADNTGNPVDTSCGIQQTVDAFQTFFFVAPAPEGWSVYDQA